MDRFQRMLGQGGLGGAGGMAGDAPQQDTSEQIYISSLALLKMLKHGRAGVPMEVMGLMLGEFVDDYTVKVVDVFAMPQSGTGVSVEAVDPVFQTKMLDMLKQVGRCVRGRGLGVPGLHGAGDSHGPSAADRCWPWVPGFVVEEAAGMVHCKQRLFCAGGACSGRRCGPSPTGPTPGVQAGDGGGLVPLPPGIWVLAVGRGREHAAVVRSAERACGGGGHRPHPVGQGQGGHRRLPVHQPPDHDAGPGGPADHQQRRSPEQALHPGTRGAGGLFPGVGQGVGLPSRRVNGMLDHIKVAVG